MFLCALVGPLFPQTPAPCLLNVPYLCVRLSCCCFFFVFAFLAAPARPACAPWSSPCYPCPAALRPLSRLSPLQFSFSLSTLPVRLPSLSVPRCHSCVPPACSTPAPPPRPYPFPWEPPPVPASHPILVAWRPVCGGGGVFLWSGRWPCTNHAPNEHRENVRETLAKFPPLHLHCGAQPHSQRFALRCTPYVSHGAGGHQGLAWSTPLGMAHVSSMFPMQHHPAM